ncbi:MAG: Chromosome segregation DNA-binding protein [Parcubacteria group bacterium GW2011_GWA2_56_7]|nr:MAG: Chromosome segregation DNA-binding protein [Parcubacteria group bacterium GW2011_GWA2_56_7]
MSGLGKGLDSLIPQKRSLQAKVFSGAPSEGYAELPVDAIAVNPFQPRKAFTQEEMEELKASVKQYGILQPIVVTEKTKGSYELVAGERRLRASRELGLETIPAVIRSATDQLKLEMALVENVQRKNLSPIEEGLAYQALIDEFGMTYEEVAQEVGKSRQEVGNTIHLLTLPAEMRDALHEGNITRSMGKKLLTIEKPEVRAEVFHEALDGRAGTARATQMFHRDRAISGKSSRVRDPNLVAHEERLEEILGAHVRVSERAGKGKISIHFYSKEEFSKLLERFESLDD